MAQNPYVQNLGFGTYQPGVGGSAQNPYLQQNVDTALNDISRQYQTTIAPAMASRMASANSFGNTGLQQVQSEQDRQFGQTLGNTAAQMYGAAYNTDRANDLAFTNANNANTTQRYGYDQSRAASQYGADQSRAASQYGADQSLKGSMYGADKGAEATLGAAGMSSAASMYGSDNALKIAGMNNATTQRGQDQSYQLGLGNLDNSRQQTDNSYALGLGNLGLGYTQAQNTYNLGLGTLGNNYMQNQQAYDLGLRSNDLGNATLDYNINQGNFQNQLAGANFGLNVYDRMNTGNTQAINAGQQMQDAPLTYQQQLSNMQNSIGNGYGTSTQTGSNSTAANVLGGATAGYSLANNLGLGGGLPVSDGGYSSGTGAAYGGSVDANGYWIPNRAGM